ncbi:OmpA family protein [Vibrio harveyi]|uniref:OmpA family protein n=1 Tax=Vibrio harveyi TaxID=669 RepID=UPI00234D7F1C|nr:OmpA family protein [Vibrio harveyi]EKO3865843.1 OmpA family protein [Vibrio harveyi]WCP80139.1 OmpA family protein [Vibrio harveyi]
MNKFKRDFYLVLLVVTSTPLKADYPILSPTLGIGTFYSAEEWGAKVSFGVEFNSLASGYLDYQDRETGEYLSLTLNRQIPFDGALSLVGTVGSTIWSNDERTTSVVFEPLIGVGLLYDWSPYIATSLSYQYVFSDERDSMLEPNIALSFVLKPFYEPSDQVIFQGVESGPPRELEKRVDHRDDSSCKVGIFLHSFYFAYDSAVTDIEPAEITDLKLKDYESITLIGHTDATGQAEYNQELGLKRATFVQQRLVNQGKSSLSTSVCSKGERDAASQAKQLEDWMFRRVDVYLNE